MLDLSILFPYVSKLPVVPPGQVYSKAGSVFMASVIGGGYGVIARAISPQAGIYPLHYMVWFATAYEIKECIETVLAISWNRFLQKPSESYPQFSHLLHRISLTIANELHLLISKVDHIFSVLFLIRPAHELNAQNIEEAEFLEMCRYRIWKVFKNTILDMSSFSLAHYCLVRLPLHLPSQTAIPFFIVLRSIAIGIVAVPLFHLYARVINQLIDNLSQTYEWKITTPVRLFNQLIPDL